MLWALAILFLVLWAIGFFIVHIGALIHLLIVLAVVVIVGNLLRGAGGRRMA